MNVIIEGDRKDLQAIGEKIKDNFDYLLEDRARIITLDEILAGTPLAYDERIRNYCIIIERE